MTEEEMFAGGNATITLSNHLAEVAKTEAARSGADASAALMGAALKVLESEVGNEGAFEVVKRWLATISQSGDGPSAYN